MVGRPGRPPGRDQAGQNREVASRTIAPRKAIRTCLRSQGPIAVPVLRSALRQAGVGGARLSTTSTSTGPVVDSNFSPSRSRTAVKIDGPFKSLGAGSGAPDRCG